MRTAILIALFFSTIAAAEERYIVPIFAGNVVNATTQWRSELLLTNPHAHPVDLTLETTLGDVDPLLCRFPEFSLDFPNVLLPGQTRAVCIGFTSRGAFSFRSSDEIVVMSEMTAFRINGGVTTRQEIEPGRRWIEAGESATIFHVRAGDVPRVRANLIVLNPNDTSITVFYSLVRNGAAPPTNHPYEPLVGELEVAPRSVALVPLPVAPGHDCRGRVPCGNALEHTLTLEASGRFYAATSSVEGETDATFRGPWYKPPR